MITYGNRKEPFLVDAMNEKKQLGHLAGAAVSGGVFSSFLFLPSSLELQEVSGSYLRRERPGPVLSSIPVAATITHPLPHTTIPAPIGTRNS
jgi:hypothetical protein